MTHCVLHWSRYFFLFALPALLVTPKLMAAAPQAPIRLASSATAAPFAREALAQIKQDQKVDIVLVSIGSEASVDEVRSGNAAAALISRPLSAEEARIFHARTLASDALVLIVNERNPINVINEATVRSIFQRQLSDWKQIGAGSTGAIVPVTRSAAHATRTVFDARFGIGRIVPTGIVELASNLATVLYVGADPQAVGYVSAVAFEDARRRGLRIKSVTLIDPAPDPGNCPGTGYLLCRPINLVRLHGKTSRPYQLLETYLLSAHGRGLIEQHGFTPEPLR